MIGMGMSLMVEEDGDGISDVLNRQEHVRHLQLLLSRGTPVEANPVLSRSVRATAVCQPA